MSLRNAPVRLYWYEPVESGVSVTVTVIDVGLPLQFAVGEHTAVTLATLEATARSLTNVPAWHTLR